MSCLHVKILNNKVTQVGYIGNFITRFHIKVCIYVDTLCVFWGGGGGGGEFKEMHIHLS